MTIKHEKRHQRYIMYVKKHSILRVGVNHSKSLLKHHRASDSSPCTHDDIIIMWSAFHFKYNIMWNKTADDGRGERDEVERVLEIERARARCRETNTFGLPLHTKRAPTTHSERQFFYTPFFYSFIFALSTLVVRFHREWNSFWFMMSKNTLHTHWTPPPTSHIVD